jgi:PelA/Pel-15E family pectate lyase
MLLSWERVLRLVLALVLCPAARAPAGQSGSGSQAVRSTSPTATSPRAAVEPPRRWPDDAFLPISLARITSVPVAQQAAWLSYLAASAQRARALPPVSPGEDAPLSPVSTPPRGGRHTRGLAPDGVAADWYATVEARGVADRVVAWQSPAGAWTKGIDYSRSHERGDSVDVWSRGTFDNEATTTELRFLARAIAANDPERARAWRAAFLRGLDYVFDAQYPNGGFPQVYPLAGSYHDAITYNDSAMVRVLAILRDVAERAPGYEFVPEALRAEATERLQRGVDCILATQIRTSDGRRTVWCQQHDALTGRPCAARNFEPIAASASESASICQFLMSLPDATPAMSSALDDAIAWFERVALHDVEWHRPSVNGDGLLVAPGAPLLWARLYEIGTDRPIFGDRDRTIHYKVTELSSERRLGYQWYGVWPQPVLAARRRTTWPTGRTP